MRFQLSVKIIPFHTPEHAPKSGRIDPVFRSKRQKERAKRNYKVSGKMSENGINLKKWEKGEKSRLIRAELWRHNRGKQTVLSNNIHFNPTTILPHILDSQLRYKELDSFQRMLVCTACMQSQKTSELHSIPFVFVVPKSLQLISDRNLKVRIQKALKERLGDDVQYWLMNEYANRSGNIHKHFNGEILVSPDKVGLVTEALLSLYTTVEDENGIKFAIRFRSKRRSEIIKTRGLIYAIFNWVSYSHKEKSFNKLQALYGLKNRERATLCYISRPLSRIAKKYFDVSVKK